jgi:hemerythrin superfamily protein
MPNPTEVAGKIMGQAKSVASHLMGEHGIFARLKKDHGEVWVMVSRVASSSDVETRRELFPKIRKELLAHAKAEEQMFYPVTQQFGSTRDLTQHAIHEHHEIESMLEELLVADMSTSLWLERFKVFKDILSDHVKEEEGELFSNASEELSTEQAKAMEERFEELKRIELARIS